MKNLISAFMSVCFTLIFPYNLHEVVPVNYPITRISFYQTKSQVPNYFSKRLNNTDLTDVECLAFAIYGESRGEPKIGQLAVASVIKNRKVFWKMKSYCDVVRQPYQFEFKFTKPSTRIDWKAWDEALNIAYYLINQDGYDSLVSPVSNSLYFNSLPFKLQHFKSKRYVTKIGGHYFYK